MSLSHISRFVLWGSIGFIFGVAQGSFFHVSIDIIFFIVSVVSIGAIFIFWHKMWLWCFVFFCLMAGMGSLVVDNSFDNIKLIQNSVGKVEFGEAEVVGDAIQKGWYSRIALRYKNGMTVIIKDEKYTQLAYGDVVKLRCRTSLPESYNGFDYHKYLVMTGVDYVCNEFSYEVIGYRSSILSKLARFRLQMEAIVNNIIPAPEAALANGLLFGGNDRLSKTLQNQFARTGMTHIVAVSGYNVSIIVIVVMGFVIFLGAHRKYAIWFAIVGVIFFVALIGFPSSGVRAAIMGILVLVAATYGRVAHAYGAIFFTGGIMLLFNPLLLRYDVGFQLSFLATLGIVSVYSLLEGIFTNKKTIFGIIDILLLTISAQLFVIPIIAYHFHTISLVSLLANVLILPIIPLTMLLVFLTVVTSFVFYPGALFFGWSAHFLLQYEILVIKLLARVPWGSIQIENINISWFVLYYVSIGFLIYFLNKRFYEI